MTKAPMSLQDLQRRIDLKAKAEPCWCCWGLYVQVCKRETLREAYQLAKANNGAKLIGSGPTSPASRAAASARRG